MTELPGCLKQCYLPSAGIVIGSLFIRACPVYPSLPSDRFTTQCTARGALTTSHHQLIVYNVYSNLHKKEACCVCVCVCVSDSRVNIIYVYLGMFSIYTTQSHSLVNTWTRWLAERVQFRTRPPEVKTYIFKYDVSQNNEWLYFIAKLVMIILVLYIHYMSPKIWIFFRWWLFTILAPPVFYMCTKCLIWVVSGSCVTRFNDF